MPIGYLGPEVTVRAPGARTGVAPATGALSDGSIIMVWEDATSESSTLRGQRFDDGGAPMAAAFVIETLDASFPDVALTALADGGFVVTWALGIRRRGSESAALRR